MQKINSYLVFFGLKLLSFLPLPLLYGLSNFLSWLLIHFIGYRKKVILKNLNNAFPEKNKEELQRILKGFYRFLCDLIVESIYSFSISKKDLVKRVSIDNADLILDYLKQKRPVVITLGHYGNWEWLGLRSGTVLPKHILSLYRPLKNKTMNELIVRNRQRFGLGLINEFQSSRLIPEYYSNDTEALSYAIAFIADQAVTPRRAYWIDFLNQNTNFVKGPDRYAKKFDAAVVHAQLTRKRRGYYNINLSLITEHPEHCADGFIIKRFAEKLEQQIKEDPTCWLWSHNRWKYGDNDGVRDV